MRRLNPIRKFGTIWPSRGSSGIGAIQLALPVWFWLIASGSSASPTAPTATKAICTARFRRWILSSQIASGMTISSA